MSSDAIKIHRLKGFDDPRFEPDRWEQLHQDNHTDVIYLTWHFQRAWWETLGQGKLLLTAAERDGQIVTLAPLYTDCGMIYLVGSAFDSDYLGFIGDVKDPDVIYRVLDTARNSIPDFLGFQFFFVPDNSGLGKQLTEAGERLGLECHEEDNMPAPVIDLIEGREHALKAANRKSFKKLERFYRREGSLEIKSLQKGEEILPQLDEFFQQHIARWAGTSTPSRFLDPNARRLIRRFTELAADTGWLRFTRIDWRRSPLAIHYGYCYRGRYYWGMPSFCVDMAHKSPGKLMIRFLLLLAIEEGARIFDLGTGAQKFKVELATQTNRVRTWGLYPVLTPDIG